nr:MAG TPA: hypothetical protein [Caudoviricetes sp.]
MLLFLSIRKNTFEVQSTSLAIIHLLWYNVNNE